MRNQLSLGTACALAVLLWAADTSAPLAADATIEEIVVTGSFIRRKDSFDTASPVNVLDEVDLAEQGQVNLGEIIRNQPFNYGVDAVANIIGATPTSGTFSQANLRGLGTGATLTLLDGRRTPNQNVQNLYPRIMLQRIETLTDGGSAIYGTDAVAGVVNLIPRRDFEGLEAQATYNTDQEGDVDEATWAVLGGAGNDRSSVVAALEFRDRSELQFLDRPDLLEAMVSSSGDGSPGNWLVPQRDPATGALVTNADGSVARSQVADPGCGLNNTGTDSKTERMNQRTGFLAFGTCRFEFGEFFNYIPPQEVFQGMTIFEHQFTDYVSFQGELLFSRQKSDDRGSPTNPGGQLSQLGVVPGEHPGNPYRAMAGGQPLFAADSDGDGIPDRGADGNVILAADPFDPASGIPFNEDVLASQWRPFGKFLTRPTRLNSDGSGEGDFSIRDNHWRWAGRFNVDIPDSTWTSYLDYTYHKNVFEEEDVRVESLDALRKGVTGQLFVNGENRWFNPFSTQDFACVNRDCSGGGLQTDPEAINTVDVLDRIFLSEQDETTSTLNVIDLVATGELFDLPAGPLGVAIGGQWRHLEVDADLGAVSNARDAWIAIQRLDWNENRTTLAAFAEVRVPVFDNDPLGAFEINAAVRNEDSDDDSQDSLESTDYKVAVRYEPRPFLALRGSIGTSFIAPDLEDLFEPENFALSNVADLLFDRGSTFKARGVGGNPDLKPEEADVFNVGFTLDLLDGDLVIDLNYMEFDFEDRIARPIPQDILDEDFERFLAAQAADPSLTPEEWARNFEDPRIQRNPDTLVIERVSTPLINASEMQWKGADIQVSYAFDASEIPVIGGDYGRFSTSVLATYVDEFSFKQFEDSIEVNGAGRRNDDTGFVPPIPRWRGTARLGWEMGRHSVAVMGRYTHHIEEDDNLCALPGFVLGAIGASSDGCPEKIPSKMIWDAQYTLNLDGLVWGDRRTTVQVGGVNIFDTFPPALASLGGMEVFLYDPRGAQWYVRFSQEL